MIRNFSVSNIIRIDSVFQDAKETFGLFDRAEEWKLLSFWSVDEAERYGTGTNALPSELGEVRLQRGVRGYDLAQDHAHCEAGLEDHEVDYMMDRRVQWGRVQSEWIESGSICSEEIRDVVLIRKVVWI